MNLSKRHVIVFTFLIVVCLPIVDMIIDMNYFLSSNFTKDKTLAGFIEERFLPLFLRFPGMMFSSYDLMFNFFMFLRLDFIFKYLLLPIIGLQGIYKFKKNSTFSIIYVLLFIQFFTALFNLSITILSHLYALNFPTALISFYFLIHDLFVLISAFLIIQYLSKESFKNFSIKDPVLIQNKWKRFLNSLYDTIAIYYFTHIVFIQSGMFLPQRLNFSLTNGQYVLLFSSIFILVQFIYYSVSEGLFKVTTGKILTKSLVIENNTGLISFKTAAFRTLCRLIPLQSLTFLFLEKGWHDTLSNTEVIKNIKE